MSWRLLQCTNVAQALDLVMTAARELLGISFDCAQRCIAGREWFVLPRVGAPLAPRVIPQAVHAIMPDAGFASHTAGNSTSQEIAKPICRKSLE